MSDIVVTPARGIKYISDQMVGYVPAQRFQAETRFDNRVSRGQQITLEIPYRTPPRPGALSLTVYKRQTIQLVLDTGAEWTLIRGRLAAVLERMCVPQGTRTVRLKGIGGDICGTVGRIDFWICNTWHQVNCVFAVPGFQGNPVDPDPGPSLLGLHGIYMKFMIAVSHTGSHFFLRQGMAEKPSSSIFGSLHPSVSRPRPRDGRVNPVAILDSSGQKVGPCSSQDVHLGEAGGV